MGAAPVGNVRFIDSERTHANSLLECVLAPTARTAAARRRRCQNAAGADSFIGAGRGKTHAPQLNSVDRARFPHFETNAVSLITIKCLLLVKKVVALVVKK